MQSRRPDPSFIAPAAGVSLSANPVDVVVLTTDAALLETLQQAVGGEHVLWHAQSADATVELLVGGHCGILIADLQVLRTDAANLLERLQAQFPELVLLATGRREEEHAVAGLVGSGRVYRFLHKPVSPARASLFLSAATRRYIETSGSSSPVFAGVRQFAQPSSRTGTIIGAAVAAVVLFLAWIYWPRGQQPAQEVAAVKPSEGREPPAVKTETNAAAKSVPAPPNSPNSPNSKDAPPSAAVIENLEAQVTASLAARDLPKAAVALTALQHAQPEHPRLDALRSQLFALSRGSHPEIAPVSAREQPVKAQPAAREAAPAPVAAAPKTPSNLAAARARIAGGQLTEPTEDSAVYFLRRAVAAGENESASSIVATDLGTRMLEKTRQAIATGNAEDAQRSLTSVTDVDREFELALPDLDVVRQQVNGMISGDRKAVLANQLAQATKSRESGRLIAPAGNNAYDQLTALIASDPTAPEIRTEQQRLAFTLLENTRTAMAAGDIDNAETLAKHADNLVPDMANTRTLLQQIAAVRHERELANTPVSAATLRRTREVATVYPRDAQREGIEGWVDIDFTIAQDGSTRNLVVRDAQPKDTFDKAALDALSKWRFEPVQRNGAAVAQRATVRLRFTLK